MKERSERISRKKAFQRLIIIAISKLRERDEGNYDGIFGTKNDREPKRRYRCSWNNDTGLFRVTLGKKKYISDYLQTFEEYYSSNGEDELDDDCYWFHNERGQRLPYKDIYEELEKYGLFSASEEQWEYIRSKGENEDPIIFHIGPFPSSEVEDCLDHLAKCWESGENSEIKKRNLSQKTPTTPANLLHNFPPAPQGSFVGELRATDLTAIHERITTTRKPIALTGMGGIGKTVLAREYALTYAEQYPGGRCWVNAKDGEYNPSDEARAEDKTYRISQIISFARRLQILTDTNLPLENQLEQVWEQIGGSGTLFVFDDVKNGFQFEDLLPREEHLREHVTFIGTSRMSELGTGIELYPLHIPSIEDSITLLKAIAGAERIEAEQETAKTILGPNVMDRLPLAVRLLGCYLRVKKNERLTETIDRLITARESWKPGGESYIGDDALEDIADLTDSQKGARAIFELTWGWLQTSTHKTAKLLPLFSSSFVDWDAIETALRAGYKSLKDNDFSDSRINAAEGELIIHSLITSTNQEKDTNGYTYHDLIGDFIRNKTTVSNKKQWLSFIEQKAIDYTLRIMPVMNSYSSMNDIDFFGRRLKIYEKISIRLSAIEHRLFPTIINSVAHYHLRIGNKKKATDLIDKSIEYTRSLDSDNLFIAHVEKVKSFYAQQRKSEEIQALLREAIELKKKGDRNQKPFLSRLIYYLGDYYLQINDLDNAKKYLYEAYISTETEPTENINERSAILLEIGKLHQKKAAKFIMPNSDSDNNYKESQQAFSKIIEIESNRKEIPHCEFSLHVVSGALIGLANIHGYYKDFEQAEKNLLRALEIEENNISAYDNKKAVGFVLTQLARFYFHVSIHTNWRRRKESDFWLPERGFLKKSIQVSETAIALTSEHFGETHPTVASHMQNIRECYFKLGKTKERRETQEKIVAILEKTPWLNKGFLAYEQVSLASLYLSESAKYIGKEQEIEKLVAAVLKAQKIMKPLEKSYDEIISEKSTGFRHTLYKEKYKGTISRLNIIKRKIMGLPPVTKEEVSDRHIVSYLIPGDLTGVYF